MSFYNHEPQTINQKPIVSARNLYRVRKCRITFSGDSEIFDGVRHEPNYAFVKAHVLYLTDSGPVDIEFKVNKIADFRLGTYEPTADWAEFWKAACDGKTLATTRMEWSRPAPTSPAQGPLPGADVCDSSATRQASIFQSDPAWALARPHVPAG